MFIPFPQKLGTGVLVGALWFFSSASHAVGLLDLYREARLSDPQYAAAKAERESADALVTQSRGQLLPQVGLSGSRIENDQTVATRSALSANRQNYEFTSRYASLNLSQALFRPQLWAGYAQSQAQVLLAEGQFRQAGYELVLRLAQAYFDILLAEDNLALAGEQKAAIAEQLKQAKRYFEAGVGTVTDINEAQARYDTVVAQEIAAANTLEVKVRALEQVVGNVYRQLDRLGGRLELENPAPAAIEQWLDFAMANNPQIKAKEAALEVAEKEVYKNLSGHLPSIDIVASRTRNYDPSYTTINTDSWGTSVGVQLSVPLFSGGAVQGRVDQASALRQKALHELEAAKRAITLSTRQEYLNVVNGVGQVKALEQAVKSNELALYSARKGQEAGVRTSFDVLNAQQLVFSAKRDLAQERYRYVFSRLKLRAAAGLLGEEDVVLIQGWLEH